VLIDCDTCVVRGIGCHDCVVTVILNNPQPVLEMDASECDAVQSLAAAGLVPPLRLVPLVSPRPQAGWEIA
jgi:hypothetical protein